MKAIVTDKWILCPVCKAKTRTQILDDTELKHFPLFCPKCKENFIINVKDHIVDYKSIARRRADCNITVLHCVVYIMEVRRMKAIIYTSNTGSTAEYAQLLGKELNLPVHSLQQAKNKVPAGSEIIYLGWIMAGGIKGYKEAAKLYKVRAVCGVGMGQTGTQLKEVRDKNAIPQRIPLFTLQGNFDVKKLHGVYRFMMNVMVKTAGKGLANKTDRTPEEDDMLDMMVNGGKRVSLQNLKAVTEWYKSIN